MLMTIQIVAVLLIMLMYAYQGYFPKSHFREKMVCNIASGVLFSILAVATGLYLLIVAQVFAGYMSYLQYKAFEVK